MKALKKLKTSISTALSVRQSMNKNSNDGVVNINQLLEICHLTLGSGQGENMISTAHAPPPLQHNNDDKSPAPLLERNVYACSPPLVLLEDGDVLKEEGESEEHHLNHNNDNESTNNKKMGDVLHDVYLAQKFSQYLIK